MPTEEEEETKGSQARVIQGGGISRRCSKRSRGKSFDLVSTTILFRRRKKKEKNIVHNEDTSDDF